MNRNKKNANDDFRNLERSIEQNIKTAIKNADYGQLRKFSDDGDKLFEKHLTDQDTNTKGGYRVVMQKCDEKLLKMAKKTAVLTPR